ncbi:hypothetical protein DY023_01785 [Microbacterium bovistercoris]|uniref:2-nitropropane dioxygenase n=1 Tax=Microbacterium bovistercoris TaxID=2293570 RepID=A0A371NXI8_9MICO|nr:nucleotidyltransferase family protein [Microbacterium bovistercoris]REJ08019.1 hypothetical protein DY023_01785 [Microbacterium bovistercoris]
MTDAAAPRIPRHAQFALARAAVQVLADRLGVRVLHIKGDAVDPALRADPRPGSDIDVLADPRGIPLLHAVLLRHGWAVYSSFRFGSAFEHAQTYQHEQWGFLDLHRRFPGIRLDDQAAFDLLWNDRTARWTAGIRFDAPSVDAQAVLMVLNAARAGDVPAFWTRLDDATLRRCGALIDRLDARVAFAAATGDLAAYRRRREYLLWRVTTRGGPRIAEWWGRVIAQPTTAGSLRVIIGAPAVNTDLLAHRLGRPPTRPEVVGEFFSRGLRGVGEAVSIIRGGRR